MGYRSKQDGELYFLGIVSSILDPVGQTHSLCNMSKLTSSVSYIKLAGSHQLLNNANEMIETPKSAIVVS